MGRNATWLLLIELGLLACREAGAVVGHHEATHTVPAKIVGEQVPLPRIGHVPAADDLEPAVLGAARIEPFQDPHRVGSREIIRTRQAIIDALAAGPVSCERLAPAIEMMAPGIDEPSNEDIKLHRLGSELPDAAPPQPADPARCFDVAVDID